MKRLFLEVASKNKQLPLISSRPSPLTFSLINSTCFTGTSTSSHRYATTDSTRPQLSSVLAPTHHYYPTTTTLVTNPLTRSTTTSTGNKLACCSAALVGGSLAPQVGLFFSWSRQFSISSWLLKHSQSSGPVKGSGSSSGGGKGLKSGAGIGRRSKGEGRPDGSRYSKRSKKDKKTKMSSSSSAKAKRSQDSGTTSPSSSIGEKLRRTIRAGLRSGKEKLESSSGDVRGRSSSGKSPRPRRQSSAAGSSKRLTREGGDYSSVAGASDSARKAMNSVKHDKSNNRFTLDLGNQHQLARIDYRQTFRPKNNKSQQSSSSSSSQMPPAPRTKEERKNYTYIFELYHTEVPKELRGKGIGKALAWGTFEHLERTSRLHGRDVKIVLTCDYLIDYMEKYGEPRFKRMLLAPEDDTTAGAK